MQINSFYILDYKLNFVNKSYDHKLGILYLNLVNFSFANIISSKYKLRHFYFYKFLFIICYLTISLNI